MFINIRALQEADINPAVFIADIESEKYENLLVPLRIDSTNRCVNGEAYIKAFVTAGWMVKPIVVFGRSALPYVLTQKQVFIPDSAQKLHNQNANIVKQTWGWAP